MAETVIQTRHMTLEEAARLDPDRQPGELVDGEWIPVTRNTWRHGEIAGNAYALLRSYARSRKGWRVAVGDPGTKLKREPATLRGPDVAMVRENRKPTGRGVEGWLEGAPDVVVEVAGELMRKALEYIEAGSQLVWLLDPEAERVIVVTPPDHYRVLTADETLDGGDVLPGFSCAVRELFE